LENKPEIQLSRAHLQLTRNCNLNCSFCGQRKGALGTGNKDLPFEMWLDAARAVKKSAQLAEKEAWITLWGGEPLLYPEFNHLAKEIHHLGCHLEVVSNGTLIDRAVSTLNELFDIINVSFDGFGATDDAIRGKGTFERVKNNLPLLRERRGKLVLLLTLCESNVHQLRSMLESFSTLKPDKIVLQPLIYLSQTEINAYQKYSERVFGSSYSGLQKYYDKDKTTYEIELRKQLEGIDFDAYDFELCFTPHTQGKPHPPCVMVNERAHIKYDGEVGFCTDFFGYSAGNIRDDSLENIFVNRRSEKFRKAVNENKLMICEHCPWRCQIN